MPDSSRRRALGAWALLLAITAALAWAAGREPLRAATAAAEGGRASLLALPAR